ncbi:MAG: extracellular solute-binding protein [Treponema sp.]|nr:extracellular solute-binding protein [Treponema sp.]
MKKLLLALTLVSITGFAFARGTTSQAASDGTVKLTAYMQIDMADPQYEYWGVTLDAFAKKYPNIQVEFEYVSGEQFHDKFQAMAAGGEIPDLFTCYSGARSSYILNRGMVKDLRPYLTEDFKSQFASSIWDPQGPNGEIYIIAPNMAVTTVIYINTRLQKELGLTTPTTLDELIAQVPAIRAAGKTPLLFANRGVWQAQSLLLSTLVDRLGGKGWFEKAMSGAAKFTDKPFVDSLAIVKQMVDTQLFVNGVNQMEGTVATSDFIQGNAVYYLNSGWSISSVKTACPPDLWSDVDLIFFPELNGEVSKGSSAATMGEALAMNARLTGAKEDAAWKFLSFIYGAEGADIFQRYGSISTYKLDLSKYDIDKVTKQYIDLINTRPMGYIIDAKMDGEGVNNLLNPGIQAVMMGDKTPEQLAAEYEDWVAKNDSNRKR